MSTEPAAAKPKTRLRPGYILALGLAFGLWGGVAFDRVASVGCSLSKVTPNFQLMLEAWNRIQNHYVGRSTLNVTALTYGAVGGMVDALGDTGHTTFLPPAMVKQLKEAERGQLTGIGVEIEMKNGHVVVVAPLDGSPAQRAGLRPGDIILKVDSQAITDWPVSQVVANITGRPGTAVRLTILDPHSGHTREIIIERASIKLHTVSWRVLPGTSISHVRLAGFEEGTAKELRQALTEIQKNRFTPIILDLRNNPGGILDEAVSVTSQFLGTGNVLLVKDAKGLLKPVPVTPGGVATNVPLAVLINEGTASGAEIVAGAVRDAKRATLIGKTTFGTGTVLQEFPLSDGSALLLAVQEWLTPSGQSFWHKGIAPNVPVSLAPEADILIPESEQGLTPAQLRSSGDAQLLRALELLTTRQEHKEAAARFR